MSKRCRVYELDLLFASSSSTAFLTVKYLMIIRQSPSILKTLTRKCFKLCEIASEPIWVEKLNRLSWLSRVRMRFLIAGTWMKFDAVLKLPPCTPSSRKYRALSKSRSEVAWRRALSWPWNKTVRLLRLQVPIVTHQLERKTSWVVPKAWPRNSPSVPRRNATKVYTHATSI